MRENFMHYAKDTKEYFNRYEYEGFGISSGSSIRGPGGMFRGPPENNGGNIKDMRGYPWGSHGHGNRNRFRNNYPIGHNYPIGYTYSTFQNVCTEINKDPYETNMQIGCCPGLTECIDDWNNDNHPSYLCKKSCNE